MGSHQARKKNIMLEQEVVKGFELILHRKKEKILLKDRALICKVSASSFPNGGIQVAYNFFQVSGRCRRDFFKVL